MQTFKTFGKILFILALTTGLAACGGGGGTVVPTGASTTITGSAGDGPVQNGNVSVLDANGAAVTTTPANPTTGANAQFSFTVPSGTALPLIITVTGGTDTVTGATPPDFDLRTAVTSLPANGNVTGNANPLSTLAVASAEAQAGGITTASLDTATKNVLGAMGFGLPADPTTGINPISTPVDNINVASLVRASEAAAELIRRASNSSGATLANTITAIAQDLTDGVVDGNTATLAAGTISLVSPAIASHILNQQAQVSAETLANNLTVTTPAGVAIPGASGANFATTLDASITAIGHTGNISGIKPTQAFLDQTRSAINIANTLTGGGNAALNNLLGSVNSLTAGTVPSTAQQTSLATLTGAATFPTPTNITANATNATNAATAAANDTTAPVAPTLTAPTAGLTNINTPTVSGAAEPNAVVTVLNGATSVGTTAATGTGAWTMTTSALADGAHTLTAKATDAAGNTSLASTSVVVTVDTTAPVKPTISVPTTGSFTRSTTPTVSGSSENGATVKVYDTNGTTLLGTTTAHLTTGAWTLTSNTLSVGSHTLTAKATDAAGNTSLASTSVVVTVDTTAPVKPTISVPTTGSFTRSTTPTVSGSSENGATVKVYDTNGTTLLGTTTAHLTTGAWTLTSNTLSVGSHTLTAKATDAAGNTSLASTSVVVTVDTTAPVKPVISIPANNATVTTQTPTVTGTAENGALVELFAGVTSAGTATANNTTGAWSITSAALTNNTNHVLTAKATDAAGNVSAASTAITITVSSTTSISGAVIDGKVKNATLTLYSDKTFLTQIGTGNTNTSGAFSISITGAVPNPIYIKSVGGTDIATGMPAPTMRFVGNTSGANLLTSFNITPLTNDVMTRVSNGIRLGTAQFNAQTAFGLNSNTGANGLYSDPTAAGNTLLKTAEFKKLTAGTTGGTLSAGNYKMFSITLDETDIAAPASTIANIAALTNPVNGNFVDANVTVDLNGNISGQSGGGKFFQGKVVGSSVIFNIVDNVTTPTQVTRVVGNIGLNGSVAGNFTSVTGIGTTNTMTKGVFVGSFIPTGVQPVALATFLTDFYTPGATSGKMNIITRDIFTANPPRVRWGQIALTALDVPGGSATMSAMALRIDVGSAASATLENFAFTNGVYLKTAAPALIPTNLLVFQYTVTGGGNLFIATAVGLRRGIYFVTNSTNKVITIGEAYLSKINSAVPNGFTAGVTHDVTIAATHAGMPGQSRTAILNQALTPTSIPGGFTVPNSVTIGNGFIDTTMPGFSELMISQGSMFVMKQDASNDFLNNRLSGGLTEDHLRVMEFFESGAMQGEDIQGGAIPGGSLLMRNFPNNIIGFVHNPNDPLPSFSGSLNFLARTQYATSFAGFANAFTSGSITITAPTTTAPTAAGSATLIATPAGGTTATSTLTIDVPATGAPGVYHIHGVLAGGGYIDLVWPIGGTKALYVVSASATGTVQEVGEAFITQ